MKAHSARRRLVPWTVLLFVATVLATVSVSGAALWTADAQPKYAVALYGTGVELVPAPTSRLVTMRAAGGREYRCAIPAPEQSASTASSSSSPGSPSAAASASAKAADDSARPAADLASGEAEAHVLAALGGHCLRLSAGWWTFEYCHEKHVRQYHMEKDVLAVEFILGRAPSAPGVASEPAGPTGARYSVTYGGGTPCDLTGVPRSAEVRFSCRADGGLPSLVRVSEPLTCKYLVEVDAPVLCALVRYAPARARSQTMHCVPSAERGAAEPDADDGAWAGLLAAAGRAWTGAGLAPGVESVEAGLDVTGAPRQSAVATTATAVRTASEHAGSRPGTERGAVDPATISHVLDAMKATIAAAGVGADGASRVESAIANNGVQTVVIDSATDPEAVAAIMAALDGTPISAEQLADLIARTRAARSAAEERRDEDE